MARIGCVGTCMNRMRPARPDLCEDGTAMVHGQDTEGRHGAAGRGARGGAACGQRPQLPSLSEKT